jgi:TonB family protein
MRNAKEHSLKSMIALLVVAILTSLAPLRALAGDFKVIANSSVKADVISADEIKQVYLRERSSLGDGTHVEPVMEKRGSAHDAFLKNFLDINDDALQTYYRTLVFTGKGSMPKALGSDAEVVAYVARTRGAIGYVNSATSTEGVKILLVLSAGSQAQRTLLIRVEPEYPETLKRLLIGGTVRLSVTISPKGNVETAELLGGNPILGESAIAAVKKWAFAANHSRTRMEVSIPFDPNR